MPRWTAKQADEVRERVLLAVEKDGGTVARKSETVKYLTEKSKFPSKTGFTTFLKRMERDGLITLTNGPGTRPLIYAVALVTEKQSTNGNAPKVEPAKVESPAKPAVDPPSAAVEGTPAPPPPQPAESVSLVHLEARVRITEERARAILTEAAEAMRVIEFLRDPPAELDVSKMLRDDNDRLMQENRDLKRKASDREKEAAEATRRLGRVNETLATTNGEFNVVLEQMNRILQTRTRSGQSIREMLTEGDRKKVEGIVKRQSQRKKK